jgi:hypothetical protein
MPFVVLLFFILCALPCKAQENNDQSHKSSNQIDFKLLAQLITQLREMTTSTQTTQAQEAQAQQPPATQTQAQPPAAQCVAAPPPNPENNDPEKEPSMDIQKGVTMVLETGLGIATAVAGGVNGNPVQTMQGICHAIGSIMQAASRTKRSRMCMDEESSELTATQNPCTAC